MAKKKVNTQTLRGNERKSVSAKVSREAHEKISDLAPKTSREIIDLWFYHYYEDERPTSSPKSLTHKESTIRARLEVEAHLVEEAKEKFERALRRNPRYIKVSVNKPPNAIIDAAILSLFSSRGMDYISELPLNQNQEHLFMIPEKQDETRDDINQVRVDIVTLVGRKDLIRWARSELEKPIAGTSWSEFHHTWFANKNSFEKTIDNRLKSLMYRKILTNVIGLVGLIPKNYEAIATFPVPIDAQDEGETVGNVYIDIRNIPQEVLGKFGPGEKLPLEEQQQDEEFMRGTYTLIREISVDEWAMIGGVLNLRPQDRVSIPKLL